MQPREMAMSETPHSLKIPVPEMESKMPAGPRIDAAIIRYMYQSRICFRHNASRHRAAGETLSLGEPRDRRLRVHGIVLPPF